MHEILQVFHASPKLAAVGSVDEAVVIGAALSLSSSAFVLQLLSERGELATKFGSATLGILLLQVRHLRCTALSSNNFQTPQSAGVFGESPTAERKVPHWGVITPCFEGEGRQYIDMLAIHGYRVGQYVA